MDWSIVRPMDEPYSHIMHVVRADGMKGFAKPAFKDDKPQGAVEKIASELGQLIGIPTSQVELVALPIGECLFAISLQPYESYDEWKHSDAIRYDEIEIIHRSMLNMAYVFQTWIGDCDHSDSGQNLIVGRSSESDEWKIQFFDYSNSLIWSWNHFGRVALGSGTKHLGASDPQEQANAAVAISRICIDDISRIVDSVGPRFNNTAELKTIPQNLVNLQRPLLERFGCI